MNRPRIAHNIAIRFADMENMAAKEIQVPIHDPDAEHQPLIGISSRHGNPIWYIKGENARNFDSPEKFIDFMKSQMGRKSVPYVQQLLQLGQRSGLLSPDTAHSLAQSATKI